MSCEFINKKNNKHCDETAVNGYVYCAKHKRYAYGKQNTNVETQTVDNISTQKQQKKKVISSPIVEQQQSIPEQNENIDGIDMSNIMNNNDESVISAQNSKFDEHIKPDEQKIFDGEEYDESIECDELSEDYGEPMQDPDDVAEMLYDVGIHATAATERLTQALSPYTSVYLDGLTDKTISGEAKYKKLLKMTYRKHHNTIDKYVTPTLSMLMYYSLDTVASVRVGEKKNILMLEN